MGRATLPHLSLTNSLLVSQNNTDIFLRQSVFVCAVTFVYVIALQASI